MSHEQHRTEAHRAIDDWIEERTALEDLAALPHGDSADRELLRLLAAEQQTSTPDMSPRDGQQVLDRVRSQILAERAASAAARGRWLAGAAAVAVLTLGLAVWSGPRAPRAAQATPRPRGTAIKQVRFESVHNGKRVRFEMDVSKTQGREVPRVAPR